MEKIELDRETVTKLMEEVVAEFGEDYTVDQCRYVDENNKPVCIVGHVLVKAGLDPEFFHRSYDNYGTSYNSTSFEAIVERDKARHIELPSEVVRALAGAQRVQDGHYTNSDASWGKALQKYKNSLEYDENQEAHEVPC